MIHGDELQPCPAGCYGGYTNRARTKLCPACGGDGYSIRGRVGPRLTANGPDPVEEEVIRQKERRRILRVADRLELGLCTVCGEEPLVNKNLGARCYALQKVSQKKTTAKGRPEEDLIIG